MKEEVLQFIWRHSLFKSVELLTDCGKSVKVREVGDWNVHSGPDFFLSKVEVDDFLWVGCVEIHIKASDWYRHNHQSDPSYNTVVLHVVWLSDTVDVERQDGGRIVTLNISKYVNPLFLENYKNFILEKDTIKCKRQWGDCYDLSLRPMLFQTFKERFLLKTQSLNDRLKKSKFDWEDVAYFCLCKAFGFGINSIPFEELSNCLPYRIVKLYLKDKFRLEALVLGCAGFLSAELKQEYYLALRKEFLLLSHKHNLSSMEVTSWKKSATRLGNQPILRLVQFTELLFRFPLFLSAMFKEGTRDSFDELLCWPQNGYWATHYDFGKVKKRTVWSLGVESRRGLLINFIAVFLFARGVLKTQEGSLRLSMEILNRLTAERNRVAGLFKTEHWSLKSAMESQGALHLYHYYCKKNKCLLCKVGTRVLHRD